MPGLLDDLATVNAAKQDLSNVQNLLRNGLKNPLGAFDQLQGLASKYFGANNKDAGLGPQSPMEKMLARKDPLNNINWDARIYDSSGRTISGYFIDTIQTPSIGIETRSVFRSGKMQHYAGNLSMDNVNITMLATADAGNLKLASSWIQDVYDNQTGNYGLPSVYKKKIKVIILDVALRQACVLTLYGCWPTAWSSMDLSTGSAINMYVTMSLSVDSFSIDNEDGEDSGVSTNPLSKTDGIGGAIGTARTVIGQAKAVQTLFGL